MPLPGGGAPAAPLSGEIRLNPSLQQPGVLVGSALQFNIEKLTQKFNEFSAPAKAFEMGAKAMPEIIKQCSAKAYSVQDQMAAGCTGTDTVSQCGQKLLKHCVETFSPQALPVYDVGKGVGGLGGVATGISAKGVQQSAQAAAAEARNLSQMLNTYAIQVEQNAKALMP